MVPENASIPPYAITDAVSHGYTSLYLIPPTATSEMHPSPFQKGLADTNLLLERHAEGFPVLKGLLFRRVWSTPFPLAWCLTMEKTHYAISSVHSAPWPYTTPTNPDKLKRTWVMQQDSD
ncbi:hypothetical protein GOODEAATRI_024155, partial [Goodea atripinnis]